VQPEALRWGCHGWFTYGNFVADGELRIRPHAAQYHAGRLTNFPWMNHGGGAHGIFPAPGNIRDAAGNVLVTVYAVERPDGEWSLLVVNKDQEDAYAMRVAFETGGGEGFFTGEVRQVTFGRRQYVRHTLGAESHGDPRLPPVATPLTRGAEPLFILPDASLTVPRGKVKPSSGA
jgi:hypothetical protein